MKFGERLVGLRELWPDGDFFFFFFNFYILKPLQISNVDEFIGLLKWVTWLIIHL